MNMTSSFASVLTLHVQPCVSRKRRIHARVAQESACLKSRRPLLSARQATHRSAHAQPTPEPTPDLAWGTRAPVAHQMRVCAHTRAPVDHHVYVYVCVFVYVCAHTRAQAQSDHASLSMSTSASLSTTLKVNTHKHLRRLCSSNVLCK